ncbi:MAG: anacyclamide/piricyclamide family prenylated cyclic peptide [Dolichospermum sp.]
MSTAKDQSGQVTAHYIREWPYPEPHPFAGDDAE